MTTPGSTTPERFIAGAIDLGEVKARAEARNQSAADVMATFTITRENFEEDVVQRSTQIPVVVLVGSSRSEPSEQLRADFSTLAQEAGLSWIFAYLDADVTPELAQMLGVTGLPTVIALADGRPLADFQGGQPISALQQWIGALLSAVSGKLAGLPGVEDEEPEEDTRFGPATEALNNGDFDAAIAIYDAILAQEPTNVEAKAARDNTRFLARLTGSELDDPIALADASPHDVYLALAAADAEVAAGQVEAAFNRLIVVLPTDKDQVQERLLELFALFDPNDPRVIAARGKMASALF